MQGREWERIGGGGRHMGPRPAAAKAEADKWRQTHGGCSSRAKANKGRRGKQQPTSRSETADRRALRARDCIPTTLVAAMYLCRSSSCSTGGKSALAVHRLCRLADREGFGSPAPPEARLDSRLGSSRVPWRRSKVQGRLPSPSGRALRSNHGWYVRWSGSSCRVRRLQLQRPTTDRKEMGASRRSPFHLPASLSFSSRPAFCHPRARSHACVVLPWPHGKASLARLSSRNPATPPARAFPSRLLRRAPKPLAAGRPPLTCVSAPTRALQAGASRAGCAAAAARSDLGGRHLRQRLVRHRFLPGALAQPSPLESPRPASLPLSDCKASPARLPARRREGARGRRRPC